MSSLSPANLTSHQMLSVSDNSVGPFTVDNINGANYNQDPSMLPNNKILIPPHASAGTKSNCAAAAGKFVRYKSLAGGNKISCNSNMKGGKKLSLDPANCNGDVNHRHNALGTYDNSPVPRPLEIKGGKRRRHTMKKRKSMRKHKKHAKRHHKRSRKMHKKHKKHTRKHKRHHKKHSRKHKKHTRKHKRHSRRHHRRMRGGKVGARQPFSNVPMTFGYSANLKHLKPSMSAIASPVPIKAYDNCGKVSRS